MAPILMKHNGVRLVVINRQPHRNTARHRIPRPTDLPRSSIHEYLHPHPLRDQMREWSKQANSGQYISDDTCWQEITGPIAAAILTIVEVSNTAQHRTASHLRLVLHEEAAEVVQERKPRSWHTHSDRRWTCL